MLLPAFTHFPMIPYLVSAALLLSAIVAGALSLVRRDTRKGVHVSDTGQTPM